MSNVSKGKPVLLRLEEPERCQTAQSIPHSRRGRGLRNPDGGTTPKISARGPVTVAEALAHCLGGKTNQNTRRVAQILTSVAGQIPTAKLAAKHVQIVNAWLSRYENIFSRHRRAGAARTLLRKLQEDYGAPKLHQIVLKVASPSPRNVTAKTSERERILNAAAPHLRCWIMLCSDLAIRSGTAAILTPHHYDSEGGTLSFRTKYERAQTLPVTAELRLLLDTCKGESTFVSQIRGKPQTAQNLGMQFLWLRRSLGINRKLTPHDLRRTTARAVYKLTGDLRDAQSVLGHRSLSTTAWYLQDVLVTVKQSALELAKLSPATETIQ